MIEIWKDIKNYEDIYQISNLGRVKSLNREVIQKNRVINWPERIFKTTSTKNKYSNIKIYNKNGFENVSVHRLVGIAFVPNSNNKLFINHINGIKNDNRAENLEWCTTSENVKHAYRIGLNIPVFGDKSHSSKLTSVQVKTIKESYRDNLYTQSQLAKIYNVRVSNINMILTNRTWKRVEI